MSEPNPIPNWTDEEMTIMRALAMPLESDRHPCAGCGCWLVVNNTIQHWRKDCTAYPQEVECE